MTVSKKRYRSILDDLCHADCPSDKDCILKEFLIHAHISPRLIIQIRCVQRYKDESNKDMPAHMQKDWNKALMRWVAMGYAKQFAEVYEEGKTYSEIYEQLMKKNKQGMK